MKSSYQEYLTVIYKMASRNQDVTNKNISEWLKVSPPSVTDMLKKLEREGLVTITNNIITITEIGREAAEKSLSKHRLWEYFLESVLHYDWHEVHKDAKALQFATSDNLMNRINEYLGKPEYCPHGENIFINNHRHFESLHPLSECAVDDSIEVIRVSDISDLLDYLTKKKIGIGDRYVVTGINAFDDSISLTGEAGEVTIGMTAAGHIFVTTA